MNRQTEVEMIKQQINKLPADQLTDLSNYVDTLLKNDVQSKRQIRKLEGIWEGLGFETLEIENEISTIRSEIDQSIFEI